MAASFKTVERMGDILIEEAGLEKSKKIVNRLITEVMGNSSYLETLRRVGEYLKKK